MSRRLTAAALLAAFAAVAAPAAGQGRPPFLYLNQERVLTGSERGRALLAEEEAARDALRGEARSIEQAFEAEERALTEARATLDPQAFREKANDFDARVVKARADQDARAATLAQDFDQRRRRFYAEVAPILVGVMERAGALAIFDETTVLVADQSLNITDEVIAAIDAARPGPAQTGPAQPGPSQPGPAPAVPQAPPAAAQTETPPATQPAPAPLQITPQQPASLAQPAPQARIPAPEPETVAPRPRPADE